MSQKQLDLHLTCSEEFLLEAEAENRLVEDARRLIRRAIKDFREAGQRGEHRRVTRTFVT